MTPREEVEWRVQQLDIISAEYDEEKAKARAAGHGHSVTHASISKRHGLPPTALKNFRTNHYTPSRIARRKT